MNDFMKEREASANFMSAEREYVNRIGGKTVAIKHLAQDMEQANQLPPYVSVLADDEDGFALQLPIFDMKPYSNQIFPDQSLLLRTTQNEEGNSSLVKYSVVNNKPHETVEGGLEISSLTLMTDEDSRIIAAMPEGGGLDIDWYELIIDKACWYLSDHDTKLRTAHKRKR